MASNHHWFTHHARDLAIKLAGDILKKKRSRTITMPQELTPNLREMLNFMALTFKDVVPDGVNIFTAIRQRQGSNFVTIARGGKVNDEDRQSKTTPLPSNEVLVMALKSEFQKGRCAMLTGVYDPRWSYEKTSGQHESVILGAVFVKRWTKDGFKPVRLEWILSLASDKKDTFDESHLPLMRCFTDVCALLVNVTLRAQLRADVIPDDQAKG